MKKVFIVMLIFLAQALPVNFGIALKGVYIIVGHKTHSDDYTFGVKTCIYWNGTECRINMSSPYTLTK